MAYRGAIGRADYKYGFCTTETWENLDTFYLVEILQEFKVELTCKEIV